MIIYFLIISTKNLLSQTFLKLHRRNQRAETKTVAGFTESDCTFQTPSLSKKLGHSITSCTNIIETKAIETQDDDLQKSAKHFLKLYRRKWQTEILSHAEHTL